MSCGIFGYNDGIKEVQLKPGGGLFLVTNQEASKGKILYLESPDTPIGQARRVVCEKEDAISTGF